MSNAVVQKWMTGLLLAGLVAYGWREVIHARRFDD